MLKAATGRGVGPSGQRPLGSTARTRQLTTYRLCAAGARAAPAVTPHPCSSASTRSRLHPFGGALARTRQQQQARIVIGGAATAAAQGDDDILGRNSGGAPQDSTHGSETAASASANANAASAVAAAHLLRAALEAMKGEMGAMEGRIVKRMEVRLGKQRRRGYAGVRPGLCREAGMRTDVGAG